VSYRAGYSRRIASLDDLISKVKSAEPKTEATQKAETSLVKVRGELADEAEPTTRMLKKWVETAKISFGTFALGYEAVELERKFGKSWNVG
jgi:hypothetical protein